ncbi:GTPase-activator protein, putative [Trichomonas vaginalis G3]|uniref:GTPase-activator protein, putative n=1 Tax=Trichomonas vaginalis (strain ATCC PRA-98 / G3) TaxID=412133 RepID=A2FFI6_TRIV3|nr:negative regulation of centriole-centriole cohesion [Trichomonas vaginalis G3]EAX96316.1 GTPase-activator protein, putative [Trichomonas vaginalis G3]KAI5496389.1 negative regulation of centriole-centriole cohesion [Trichomonas vaginalis G3]|eukprot:XP_001309246.1 GTPase-activator protein [Trichomonas vaginalis G3]
MQGFGKIILHYFELLESSITHICDKELALNRSIQLDPEKILKNNFNEGCIVILNLLPNDFDGIMALVTDKIVKTAGINEKTIQKADETKFSTYCALARMCLHHIISIKGNAILKGQTLRIYTTLAIRIFSGINIQYSDYFREAFELLFAFIADNNEQIFDIILQIFLSEFKKPADPIAFQNALNPFIRLSYSTNSFGQVLTLIAPNVKDVPENCRPCIAQAFIDMMLFTLKCHPYEMYDLFNQGKDLKPAAIIISKLAEWDQRRFSISFIAKVSLFPLFPNAINNHVFYDDFEPMVTEIQKADAINSNIEAMLRSLNSNFYLIAQTKNIEIFGKHTTPLFNAVLDFIEHTIRKLLESKNPICYSLLVNYGLALYFHDQILFTKKFLPILRLSVFPSNGYYFCKFISHLCRHTDLNHFSSELIQETINAMELMTSEKYFSPCIKHIFSGFEQCPKLLELFFHEKSSFIGSIIIKCYNHNIYNICAALLKYFDFERKDTPVLDVNLLQSLITITFSFSSLVILSYLDKFTTFYDYIPEVVLQIARFILFKLSDVNVLDHEELTSSQEFKIVLNNLEVTALTLMPSNQSRVCKVAVSIIGEILNINRQASIYQTSSSPIEAYQALVTNCKNRSSVQAQHKYFMKSLMLIQKPSSVIQQAFNTLLSYFNSLINFMSPDKCIMEMPVNRINKSESTVQEEFPNVLSLLLSLMSPSKDTLISFIHNFLKSDDFIGQVVTDCLSTALLPCFYTSIAQLMSSTLDLMKTSSGAFESNTQNNIYVNHAVKVMRNILKQPYYDDTPIDTKIVTNFVIDSTAYCNTLSIIDFHVLCGHLIVAFLSRRTKEVEVGAKSSLANTIGMWISKPDFCFENKNATAILVDSLAMLLDGVNFDPQNELIRFKFFINIALLVLKQQPKLKDNCQKMLTCLFKNNLKMSIIHSMDSFFSPTISTRVVFLSAIAAALAPAQNQNEIKEEKSESFIDVLFETKFQLVESIIDLIPFSKSEEVGKTLLEASVSKNIHYEFVDYMITLELKGIQDATKNSIFRGNGIPSRLVSYFPKLFGQQWLESSFKPMILNIIKEIDRGVKCQINPSKITDGNLNLNRDNFRSILLSTISTILSALRSLPIPVVRAAQIIYHRINEVYDGLGIQIVYGFIFLRFIFPAFSVMSVLGLPGNLSEEARSCLMTISAILMATITKGSLEDKGENYAFLEDIASKSQIDFQNSILGLINLDVSDQGYESFDVDEEKVTQILILNFLEILRPLEEKMTMMTENDGVRKSAEKLLSHVRKSKLVQNSPLNYISLQPAISSNAFNKFMNSSFKNEPMQLLEQWFYRDPSPDNSVNLFILDNAKLPKVNDVSVLAYFIFKTISSLKNQNFWILADLSKFDKSMIPRFSSILKYLEMAPQQMSDNLQSVFIVCACNKFGNWMTDHKEKIPFSKIIFPKSIEEIESKIHFKPSLSTIAKESLSHYESAHAAKYESVTVVVLIHQDTIQIMKPIQGFPNEPFTMTILRYDTISHPTRTSDGFSFGCNRQQYSFMIPEGSNLYSLFQTALQRATQKHSVYISVEEESLQWLLVIISFANLVDSCNDASLNYSAFQVINSTYLSYPFLRSLSPINCPISLMPPSCKALVHQLAEDLAKLNVIETANFIYEYLKTVPQIPENVIPDTIIYLSPWVENLRIDGEDVICFSKLIEFYIKNEKSQVMFNNLIWSKFDDERSITFIFEVLNALQNPQTISIINFISKLNIKFSSEYWVIRFPENIFSHDAIHSLLMGDEFYATAVPALIYKIIWERPKTNPTKRLEMSRMLNNILAMLTLHSNFDVQMYITKLVELYIQQDDDHFEKWAENLCAFGNILGATLGALGMFTIRVELYKLFETQLLKNNDERSNYICAIFCCSFYIGCADQLVLLILQYIHFGSEENNSLLCYCFSMLEMSERICAYMILISIVILFTTKSNAALKLLNVSAFENSINSMMSIPVLASVENMTGLPLLQRPIFAFSIIASAFDDNDILTDMILRLSVYDPVMGVLSVMYHPENIIHVENFEWSDDWASIAAISITLLMKHPEVEETFMLIKKFFQRNKDAFNCFNWYVELEKRGLLKYLDDEFKMDEIQKLSPVNQHLYELHPVLQRVFNETKRTYISQEKAQAIINSLIATI